ncbi:hypothetical protein CTAYLR_007212 [Chrysophaeum taylorii]|uniref:Intraflagellar transport protein 20 n=1 Tax=Chrysophaeum taylorii TaxID=2483200 RepID=A0AAD7UBI8_9STRA|nr:hypothetical protein CTAYLR_007212 [Chrysophaeum taylorii]
MMDDDEVKVSFDDKCRVRVLDIEKFQHTEELAETCASFVSKNNEFGKLVAGIVEVLDANAQRIERAKLKAIGMRNKVLAARENRDQTRRAMQALIAEKTVEFERHQKQRNSLLQAESDQRALIDRLWGVN